ncbi:MAG: endonuclease III [Candidatus Heimdallarchaeota archaeon]|nr:endonuclease III [Candidatus Heimdallarchaeota archaeon]
MNTIGEIIHRLNEHYGVKIWERWREPVGELIRTILSQNTTDTNSLRAYANLTERFKNWEEVLNAEDTEIINEIRLGGLANTKAKKIKKSLAEIKKREGKIDLEFLSALTLSEAEKYLLSLDGVGPKTAACVLIFSFNKSIMPVDTHIHRISNRIGLVSTKSREETQEQIKGIIPEKDIYSFHINLIEHGRKVCKATKPLCNQCFLPDLCSYYKQNFTQETS